MKIRDYLVKTRGFFKDLFGYSGKTKDKLDNKVIEYEKELISLYNNFMLGLERIYSGFSGEKLQFQPIISIRKNYDDLFSENIRREFNIYKTNKGLILRRKSLEEYL